MHLSVINEVKSSQTIRKNAQLLLPVIMKICLAQIKSIKGAVEKNIQKHLKIAERAVKLKADLLIFPELSLTGYEPSMAKSLAINSDSTILNPFQVFADAHNIVIGVGVPIKLEIGINIGLLIFQPNADRFFYAKQLLHADEVPYFTPGKHQPILSVKGVKIAFGICYETLQKDHLCKSIQKDVAVYIASVAKSSTGIQKAFQHFPKMAREFKIPFLMVNSIGFCDNFLSMGQSAVWNKKGALMNVLDTDQEGLLIYNTTDELAEKVQPKIRLGKLTDLNTIFEIYKSAKHKLDSNGLFQWNSNYPTISIIADDIKKGLLYILTYANDIIGAINISEEQEKEYESVNWLFDYTKVLVIHRLVVDPKHQGQGFASALMDFAENYAKENNYTSIRLDAYSQNKKVLEFYRQRAYLIRGDVNFPGRAHPFYCMEKQL